MKRTLEAIYAHTRAEGECRIWTLSVNSTGYPQANFGGPKPSMVRRTVAELSDITTAGNRVLMLCGNKMCVWHGHMGTQAKGGMVRAKLTLHDVMQIKASSEPTAALVKRYGRAAAGVRWGNTWRDAFLIPRAPDRYAATIPPEGGQITADYMLRRQGVEIPSRLNGAY